MPLSSITLEIAPSLETRRHSNILRGVVEDEVFEMDELAVDPQRGAGIGEVHPFEEACADARTGDTLVQTREGNAGVESRPHQSCHADFREIVSH
jgi:hypothetical protein